MARRESKTGREWLKWRDISCQVPYLCVFSCIRWGITQGSWKWRKRRDGAMTTKLPMIGAKRSRYVGQQTRRSMNEPPSVLAPRAEFIGKPRTPGINEINSIMHAPTVYNVLLRCGWRGPLLGHRSADLPVLDIWHKYGDLLLMCTNCSNMKTTCVHSHVIRTIS